MRKFFSFIVLAGLTLAFSQAPVRAENSPPPSSTATPMRDEECLSCHNQPDMRVTLPSGEMFSLSVDGKRYRASIHGEKGYACTQCHTNITGFPHQAQEARSRREISVQMAQTCGECHTQAQAQYDQGFHAMRQRSGRLEAAVCSDCHGAHDIQPVENGESIPRICQRCHSEIYAAYAQSVHGKALLEENNTDVPTCETCHAYHNNAGPSKEGYHLYSPQLCATCHADPKLMEKYGIRTDVFETYVADFHGTTVTIFEQIAPDQETNKPACIDCHGVHSILSPTDENSPVLKQNLLRTCQRCHPGATPEFSEAWLSHYQPDWQTAPLVTAVNWFYRLLIPVTVGSMVLFVSTDFWRHKIVPRLRRGDKEETRHEDA